MTFVVFACCPATQSMRYKHPYQSKSKQMPLFGRERERERERERDFSQDTASSLWDFYTTLGCHESILC